MRRSACQAAAPSPMRSIAGSSPRSKSAIPLRPRKRPVCTSGRRSRLASRVGCRKRCSLNASFGGAASQARVRSLRELAAAASRESLIHDSRLSIPGSRALLAPRNDGSAVLLRRLLLRRLRRRALAGRINALDEFADAVIEPVGVLLLVGHLREARLQPGSGVLIAHGADVDRLECVLGSAQRVPV